jgi:cell division protein FtsI/penicillin-binding protein 2
VRRSTSLLSVAALAAALGVGAWQGARLLGDDDGDRRAADAFAEAWVAGEVPELADVTAGLTPGPDDRPRSVSVASVRRDGDRATAVLDVRWALGAAWAYRTELPLRRSGDAWRPVVGPSVAHPELAEDQALRSRLVQAPRAPITDRTGTPIVQDRPVVTVGLQPSRATDLPATVTRVAELTGVEAPGLLERARSARPDDFVEVVVLRREAYDAVRPELRPVPGVVLREGTRQLAPTAAFARALLGSVGPATAEVVEQSEGRVRADQSVGLSGLQRRYDDRLGGTPGLDVELVDGSGGAVRSLSSTPPVPGTPLQLTLDPAVQTAADAALATAPEGKGAALVVVQPSTGDVLAVANAGPDGPGVDRALTGRYPPGSTFKTASALALLRAGLRVDEVVPCPATTSVDGKSFKNAEDEVLGDQPFWVDFAHSCNTAFVASADRLSSAALESAARDLGLTAYDLELDVFGADVPVTSDEVEHAAQVIGQGRVLASPLAVAVSAATVESGRLRLPRLLAEAPASAPGPELPEAADLQALTRAVVTDGTGTALQDLPGEPVRGKTGTAEYGTEVPPRTHAWFAGSSADLAFAVLVEDGGFGGSTAAPVAAQLLRALRQP